jgi:drug/metabolite transporter (DMT)-like permease
MEPVFAGIFSVAFGHEHPTYRVVIGAICVLVAMLIAQVKFTAGKQVE